MLFKLSYLNSNFELTLGYRNPALNDSVQDYKVRYTGVKTSARNVNERRHIENDEYSCSCSMTSEYVPFCYNFVDVILTCKKSQVFNISVQK